ncbi:hypothetical protein BLNAU_3123 [Blattamonas nauphoetae]|uniref:Uncharacterized protein n=1 Tax=Blattamonas nauphoetae TaxID=2049346 RepID=A0ABQ9YE74_9EUKA|nr:hypothetical protein BLNAU_3123 [Blattamonas nauphoetae]
MNVLTTESELESTRSLSYRAKFSVFQLPMMQIYVIAIFTSLLRPHIAPSYLRSIVKPSFPSELSDCCQHISLPEGVVHSQNYALISSSIVMKGQPHTSLRYLDASCDRENLIVQEGNSPPSNGIHSLFNLQNATLSVVDVLLDMLSETVNHDVKCAVLDSSTIHVSFCEFFWTDLKSLFVLQSSSPTPQASSSLTLAWCTLRNPIPHLMPIVEDMRKSSAAGTFSMNIVGTRIANMKVVGADGVCVSQTNHRNDLCSFEGISTTISEMRILNVSSLPGEVKEASSLFSQRMVGCAIWGSNNHLSGTVLRDVNGGGSFLCSNSTFDCCHTTSSERPLIVPSTSPTVGSNSFPATHSMPNEDEPADDPNDPYTGKEYSGSDRFNFTAVAVTFTRCKFTNMKYSFSSLSAQLAGGSAIYFHSSSKAMSLVSCTFSNCSVSSSSPVYGGCVYLYNMKTSTNTVTACSFDDWYPSNGTNSRQHGGAIGTYWTPAPLVITESNFTLSGETTHKYNGGFFACYSPSTRQSTTIDNCRFVGDSSSTGLVLSFDSGFQKNAFFSITDSQILNTNSWIEIIDLNITSSSGFTRTEMTNTSIEYDDVLTTKLPHLIVDCKLNQCSVSSEDSDFLLLFLGTSFTGKSANTSRSTIYLSDTTKIIFHKCDFTDCSIASSHSLIYSDDVESLVVDTCSFTRCSGGRSIIDVQRTPSFFSFCTFTNVTGTTAYLMMLNSDSFIFIESCRFDLETSNRLDFDLSTSLTYEKDTIVTACTSNRKIYIGTSWTNRIEMMTVQVVPIEAGKSEMRVVTEPTEEDQTFTSLSEAFAAFPSPLLDTVITFSDGSFTEDELLEVSQLVEIVGAGWVVSDFRSTQLTTNGFVSKSTCKLTLHSLQLVPFSTSSILASTEDSASLCLLNVIVEDISEHSECLFLFAAGSCGIHHSFFKNIKSEKSLIYVSGTSSLAVTNTLFLTIQRTSSKPNPVEDKQCASCIEGKTSGTIKVMYSRFGACTTNGRAGAIDLMKNDDNSAVEIGHCYFDQNSAGEDVYDFEKGDDVVLKSFDKSKINLDLSSIISFPSVDSFLVNWNHPFVSPPSRIDVSDSTTAEPLGWSYPDGQISPSFLQKYPLQYLLEHRFWNANHVELNLDVYHHETMRPFVFQNSTVYVNRYYHRTITITVYPYPEVFITLKNATLSFFDFRFEFDELTKQAFTCDQESSIELRHTEFRLTNPTLTHPFIDSIGRSVVIYDFDFYPSITLDNTPFIRLIRAEKNATLDYSSTTTLLASPLTVPFIICEGAKRFNLWFITLSCPLEHSASFAFAKDSTVELYSNTIRLLKSTAQGTFLHLENGAVFIDRDNSSSSSAEQGGLIICRNSTVTSDRWKGSSCSAKQGGVLYSEDCSVSIKEGTFSNCQADEGGVAFVVSSTLTIADSSFVTNSAKSGGAFWVDFINDIPSSVSWKNSTFTANSALDEDENVVQSGHGGAIHARLLSTHSLAVEGCSFDGCSCSKGGGGVYVDLRSSTLADKTQQVVVGSAYGWMPTSFTDCTSKDGRGHWILVDMNPSESNTFSVTLEDSVEDTVQSNHEGVIQPIPLTPYVFVPPSVFISDEGGNDTSACLADSPCLSFSKVQEAGIMNSVVTKPVTIKSENENRATLNLKNVTAKNNSSLEGYLCIAEATRLDTIDVVLFQATTRVAFVTLTTDTTLTISNVEIRTDTSSGMNGMTFQSAFLVNNGQIIVESLSFSSDADFDVYSPMWLAGGSLMAENENEVAMRVRYGGDRGWIGIEGDTVTSTYPNLKLKKWRFGGSPTAQKSHGLWLKDVGIVELTSCSFSSFKKGSESDVVDGSAIHAELSSSSCLRITSCTFESCSSEGNGGSVSVVVAGGELDISYSTFSSSSSQQNGGALFVDLSSLGSGSYRLTSLTFKTTCTCSGDGKWVFIQGHNLASLMKKQRWAGTFNSLGLRKDSDKLWGFDLAEDASSPRHSISLLRFLLGIASRTPDSTIFVGQSGEDDVGCGNTEATLCRTIEWSMNEAAGSIVDVVVASNGLLSSPIVLSQTDVHIAPDSGIPCPFAISLAPPSSAAAAMISVERNSALTLSFLSFSFSVPATIDSIVVSSSGVVTIDSCRVQGTTLSQPFLVSTQSSHTISNSAFLSSTFKSSAFVLSDCQSLSIEDSSVANNSFDTSFLVCSSSQISFVSLTVSNNSIKQDASLFALSILPKTTLEDTPSLRISFSSFTSSQTTPTPLFVSVASECRSNVILVNSTFSHSSSSQAKKAAVVVKWTKRQPLLLRRRVVCDDCFVMVSQSQ